MDPIDRKLLARLMEHGRSTWVDLAEDVGLSAPSVTERVRKLESAGIIRRYAALVDPAALRQSTLAYVSVSMASTGDHTPFLDAIQALPNVQECHIVAGDFDYLLKVRCADGEALATFLRERIRTLPSVSATSSVIALQTLKETPSVPLGEHV